MQTAVPPLYYPVLDVGDAGVPRNKFESGDTIFFLCRSYALDYFSN